MMKHTSLAFSQKTTSNIHSIIVALPAMIWRKKLDEKLKFKMEY